MTNAERILAALDRGGPMTDTELRVATGIEPHQQVNQICRRLAAQGVIARATGPGGHLLNSRVRGRPVIARELEPRAEAERRTARTLSTFGPFPLDSAPIRSGGLLMIPCCKRKAAGGSRTASGPSILDLLPPHLANSLGAARTEIGQRASLDQRRLLPAWERYQGTLYSAAKRSIRSVEALRSSHVVILSGGYGLLLPEEPIGTYDQRFKASDWPSGLLEECLTVVARRLTCSSATAFCAATTSYADVVRRTQWGRSGITATLATPDLAGRGGAQVIVPRAAGEAFAAAVSGRLGPAWSSSDNVTLRLESCS